MPKAQSKQLTKGKSKKISGVCSGVAEYFGLDVALVRLLWIVVTAFSGFAPGIIAYIMAAVVLPDA